MAFEEIIGSILQTIWKYNMVILMTLYMAYNYFKSKQPFPESGGLVKGVHSQGEFDEVMSKNKFVLLDFYATWCPPCRTAAPVFGTLSEKYIGATFIKIDVDECKSIAAKCKVSAMPTFQLYRDGKLLDSVTGFSQSKIEAMLQKNHVQETKHDK